MGKKTFFISTAIPYVNAAPHIGHALEFVQADVIARYRRLIGDDVFFLTGTDDNALKNVKSAAESGVPVQEFVDSNAERFKRLCAVLCVSNDDFIRTSIDERHISGAQKLWKSLNPNDVYKKKYRGTYCVGCEEFKVEKDLVDGCCPDHPNSKLEIVEEENYFFKLSNYQEKLLKLVRDDDLVIIPETRRNEILRFMEGGLEDFSISRSNERAKNWGIPVPGDSAQRQYVWVDALSNYITALGYATGDKKFEHYWQRGDETTHVIGKGINRFHSIYWPAMLLSADLRVPKHVFVHGYITVDGQKISKSLGNVIDPFEIVEKYGADALRFWLLHEMPTFDDGDFTWEKFKASYNAYLANGLGNLASRVMKMAVANGIRLDDATIKRLAATKEVDTLCRTQTAALEKHNLQEAIHISWALIAQTDALIQEREPFKKIKTDKDAAEEDIRGLLARLEIIATTLQPFLPTTSEKILEAIKTNSEIKTPLFPRVN